MPGPSGPRSLLVIADDYGIGPATSQGILDLACRGVVTGAVLLVNSPHAEAGVKAWRRAAPPADLGWHPCLTLDAPVLPAGAVPSLVGRDGQFHPLRRFLTRLLTGRIRQADIHAEFQAQLHRFWELTGGPPALVNAHHHVQVFHPVGSVLRDVLSTCRPQPYVRRVREPFATLRSIRGAQVKRWALSTLGRWIARHPAWADFPGNDWLAGITDPPCVRREDFLVEWLTRMPGSVVELTCHPGDWDDTLLGRDAASNDGQQQRRVDEKRLLLDPSFRAACDINGFRLTRPSDCLTNVVRQTAA